jgi:hypothetical protein
MQRPKLRPKCKCQRAKLVNLCVVYSMPEKCKDPGFVFVKNSGLSLKKGFVK